MDTEMDVAISAERSEAIDAHSPMADNTLTTLEITVDTKPLISKYAAKQQNKNRKLSVEEESANSRKIKKNKYVNTADRSVHKKVSRNLLLTLRNEKMTVVCDKTGVVSIMHIPSIPGKAMVWRSPLAMVPNARSIVQEGYEYLNLLDTQIIAGLFITLSTEYDLIRTTVDQSGAATNSILRTASKEKLIQACLMVECYIHSLNHIYQPKLSLVYDEDLRNRGAEPRLTEWMRLVDAAIQNPDVTEYDENALLEKPMRSIADLKKEHTAAQKELKRTSSLKDKLFKERAAFRKDMKEARMLVSNMKDTVSQKMISFMKQLFQENSYLTVDTFVLGQLITKLQTVEHASAKGLITILETDRSKLRAEVMLDDLDDILIPTSLGERSEARHAHSPIAASDEANSEEEHSIVTDDNDSNETLEPFTGEFKPIHTTTEQAFIAVHGAAGPLASLQMPEGLSFVEKMLWKKKNGVK